MWSSWVVYRHPDYGPSEVFKNRPVLHQLRSAKTCLSKFAQEKKNHLLPLTQLTQQDAATGWWQSLASGFLWDSLQEKKAKTICYIKNNMQPLFPKLCEWTYCCKSVRLFAHLHSSGNYCNVVLVVSEQRKYNDFNLWFKKLSISKRTIDCHWPFWHPSLPLAMYMPHTEAVRNSMQLRLYNVSLHGIVRRLFMKQILLTLLKAASMRHGGSPAL